MRKAKGKFSPTSPDAETRCQACGFGLHIPYIRLGAVIDCPSCLALTIPQIPEGGPIPVRRYELTYRDFRQLIEYPPYRHVVAPIIADWFGYSIVEEKADVWVRNQAGEMIDTLWLHLAIQADSDKQQTLYGTAMSLWR